MVHAEPVENGGQVAFSQTRSMSRLLGKVLSAKGRMAFSYVYHEAHKGKLTISDAFEVPHGQGGSVR